MEIVIARELLGDPHERLLEVSVRLSRYLVVLQVLLAVVVDLLRLHLAILDVDFVAAEHNGDVLAHAGDVAVPRGHGLVGDARGDVEHNDGTFSLDIIAIA